MVRNPPVIHDTRQMEFGGWEMPVSFDSITVEHAAVRDAVGKFDVSHMGEITVSGPDATRLMGRLTTNDVGALDPGEGQYSAITDADGVLIDDTVVYRLPADSEAAYLFVPNAGNDEAMTDRWQRHRDRWNFDATVSNRTEEYALIALQGPDAPDRLATQTDLRLSQLSRFDIEAAPVAGVDTLVARTGYTGEDGFEIFCPWEEAETLWNAFDCQPCGLGARDTLRIEMGYLLAGQDFDHEDNPRNPYEAGIGFVVSLDTEFVGRDALEGVDVEGAEHRFVGVVLTERGVPRHGHAIRHPDGGPLGTVTSGTMSPTLDEPIALGYVPPEYASEQRSVRVVIRDEPKKARTTNPPFLS